MEINDIIERIKAHPGYRLKEQDKLLLFDLLKWHAHRLNFNEGMEKNHVLYNQAVSDFEKIGISLLYNQSNLNAKLERIETSRFEDKIRIKMLYLANNIKQQYIQNELRKMVSCKYDYYNELLEKN